ncbi:MAG TPA: lamin tail domain-containing protein, partial [Bacteroidetes bacterium]|nr:lamin tail domain-containing protein [Bacteroidota bacterium]
MKTKIWVCAACAFGATLLLLVSRTLSVNSQVVLSEIMFNAPVSEYYEEFIELHNASPSEEINLSGYSVGDQQEQDLLI